MSTDYQVRAVFTADTTDAMAQISAYQQKLKEMNLSGAEFAQQNQRFSQSFDQIGTKSAGASGQLGGFTSNLKAAAGPIMAMSGGILGLVTNFVGLERAGVMAQRMQERYLQAVRANATEEDKLNKMKAAGLEGTAAYNKELEKYEHTQAQVKITQDAAAISQERLNVMWANFIDNIMPSALSILGGVTGTMQVFGDKSNTVTQKITGLIDRFKNMNVSVGGLGGSLTSFLTGPVGLALIGIGALATVLTLVATNAFGFRDALNAAGKALGDAVPFLKPILIGIKALGEQVGLTGNDVKQGFSGMGDDVSQFQKDSQTAFDAWSQGLNKMGEDASKGNWRQFWVDTGNWMLTNFTNNMNGIKDVFVNGWAAIQANIKSNIDGWKGIIGTGAAAAVGLFQAAWEGLSGWFTSNVSIPVINAWNSLIGVFQQTIVDPIQKAFANTGAWFEEHVAKPIRGFFDWISKNPILSALTGIKVPAAAPPAAPPAAVPEARGPPPGWENLPSEGGRIPKTATPQTLTDRGFGIVPAAYAAPAAPKQPDLYAMAGVPRPTAEQQLQTRAAALKGYQDLGKAQQENVQEALKFADTYGIKIPEAFNKSAQGVLNYTKPLMDEGKKLDENYAAASAYLNIHKETAGVNMADKQSVIAVSGAYEGLDKKIKENNTTMGLWTNETVKGNLLSKQFTLGVQDQMLAFDKNKEAVAYNAGSIATYADQLGTADFANTQFTLGQQEQQKALLDSIAGIQKTWGVLAEYNDEMDRGQLQAVAYTQGIQKQQKATMDDTVAIAGLVGQQQELDRELQTGVPQANAYAEGWLKVHEQMQKLVIDTANLKGQLGALNAAVQDGKTWVLEYNKGIQEGRVEADNWFLSLSEGAGKQQAFHDQLLALAKIAGVSIPESLKSSTKGIQEYIGVMKGVPDEVQKVFDDIKGNGDKFISGMGEIGDKFKEWFGKIPKWMQAALPKDMWEQMFQKGQIKNSVESALGMVKNILGSGDPVGAQIFSRNIAGILQKSLKDIPEQMRPKFMEIINMLNNPPLSEAEWAGWVTKLDALITGLNPAMNAFKSTADKSFTAPDTASWAKWSKDMTAYLAAPFTAVQKQKGPATALQTMIPGLQAPIATKGAAPTPQAAPAAGVPGFDIAAATNALKAFQAQVQAIMNNIVIMVAGVAAAFNTQFAKGAQDAAGSLNRLMGQAQADMNNMAAMPPGVATSMNTNFAKGANDAAGSLNNLTKQAQADMNNMAKMPTGVATSMNTNFSRGAQDAAGSLNSLQGKAQGVMNNIKAAADSAAAAVRAIGSAINSLPANKAIHISINSGEAVAAVHAIQSAIDALHGKTITNTVRTVYTAGGGSGVSGPDTGGWTGMNVQYGFHGVVNQPTRLLAGEAGEPERIDITPLKDLQRVSHNRPGLGPSSVSYGGGGLSEKPAIIIVNVGGKEVWREVRKNIFEDISQFT